MATTLMVILSDRQARFFGYPPNSEVYVEAYDIELPWPEGITFTTDIRRAVSWPDPPAAIQAWRAQSRTTPLRDDGKPNRPLTAFTVTIEEMP